MKLFILQHVSFEGPAAIEIWAREKNFKISKTCLFKDEPFPDIHQFDLLVVMGGPMNIYEEKQFPWLVREKKFIEQAIENEKLVLGICLGAQLIADVLGGRVTKNNQKEIGWLDVELTSAANRSTFMTEFPKKFTAFHWHGDTFQIPKGAIHIARSKACENQAFEYEGRVLGLQFHLESTSESIENLIEHCGNELVSGEWIQSANKIRSGFSKQIPATNHLMNQILDRFLTQIPSPR